MILLNFFTSIEFYIIMTVIAAAIVAFSARPRTRGQVEEYLLASRLSDETDDAVDQPTVEFRCHADGVTLVRRGLEGISMSGAVSLAVSTDGVNVNMQERLTPGSSWDADAREAVFELGFLTPGWYHVQYNSEKIGRFVAFQLHVRDGLVATRVLQH